MRIAVAGGTGVVGRYAVVAARTAGHEVVVLSRQRGVDVRAGDQLSGALNGVDAVIDVLNGRSINRKSAEEFFTETSSRLQHVGAAVGVKHIVTLSILGVDRASGYGYYQAKLAQERAATSGPVPTTILRASQFHEFPAQVLSVTRKGPIAVMFRMRSQPVAARTVGEHLVRVAERQTGGVLELAGPEVHEMPDLARWLLHARGVRALLVPISLPGSAGRAMRRGALLATNTTVIDGPTFDQWLRTEDARAMPI